MARPLSRYYTYIKPITENKLVRSYSPYIFSIITITVLIVFAIKPTVSTILNLQQEISNKRQTLKALTQKSQDLTQAKSNYQALGDATIAHINAEVPVQPDVVLLMKAIQDSVSLSGSTGSAVQIQPTTLTPTALENAHPALGQIDFSLTVTDSYQNLSRVIQSLSGATRLLTVSSFVISKQNQGVPTMLINGRSYYLK